mmetsp:Transcript_3741/g.8037  ORF Transcript_3741/g.8037 Transcript_3741/m.8037 type:complete len:270 (-) Transcript_3741:619-1428(-)|eukprot:CAMPEP_0202897536 /NCGR_PEP_ID=MMETSP1392-20130828/6275_1 /ASSEMBLY_ACC=CAM_ASM_000868 /TAXON_ID=225041 /ORGANISM="Chlamydomonas chlamydogama, Strain SAG 11-48b" /LENGTH=269 /DNA_ID=CAMNT_0049583209 /DNA_START=143 /DNA_END=952 /DNA_ORIENTATION=-
MADPAKVAQGVAVQYAGSAAQDHNSFDPSGKYKLRFQGAFVTVECAISQNDSIKSQGGCMVSMSNNVLIDTSLEGGLGASCLRCCCAGGSMFLSHYMLASGTVPRGDVMLAPSCPGDIIMLSMDGSTNWCLSPGNFLACDESVNITTRMLDAAQGCCGGSGFFVMEANGRGRLLASTYGAVARYDLQPGEVRKIDNGYLVAWQSSMKWSIGRATTSLWQSFLSGEGLVACFEGPGTVFVQTRSLKTLADALVPYLPSGGGGASSSNNNN